MPLTLPGFVGALVPGMLSAGMFGSEVPKIAAGIANGLIKWLPTVVVTTVDSGALGVGSGGPQPLIVSQPQILGNLMIGDASLSFFGPMSPLLTLGIANGLVLAFLQALLKTTHPSVGIGAATAKFMGASSVPSMIAGFAEASLVGEGPLRKASAIGIGLDLTFATLVVPIPIVGSASPSGGAGTGFGQII